MRIGPEPFRVQLVFISINEAGLGIAVNSMKHEVEGGRRQLAPATNEENKFAVGSSQGIIQSAIDSFFISSVADLDSTITRCQPAEVGASFPGAERPKPE